MARIIKTNNTTELVNDLSPENLQSIVGGYVEEINVPGMLTSVAIVNKDGRAANLPYNRVASTIVLGVRVFGNVVICDRKELE
jgi:hypothetical protein